MTKTETARRIVQRLIALGFVMREQKKGMKLYTPDDRFIWALPISPSDGRWFLNLRSDLTHRLREMGYDEPTIQRVRKAVKP